MHSCEPQKHHLEEGHLETALQGKNPQQHSHLTPHPSTSLLVLQPRSVPTFYSLPLQGSLNPRLQEEEVPSARSWESKASCCPSPGSSCRTGTTDVEQPHTFPCPPAALWENHQADLRCKGFLAPQGRGNGGEGQWFSLWLRSAPILANGAPCAAPCAAL